MTARPAQLAGLALLFAAVCLRADVLGDAVSAVGGEAGEVASSVTTGAGAILAMVGGVRAGWLAYHGEPFTQTLVEVIAGCALIAGVSVVTGAGSLSAGAILSDIQSGFTPIAMAVGGAGFVVGGARAAWAAAHSEKFTTQLVHAICGAAIMAAGGIAVH